MATVAMEGRYILLSSPTASGINSRVEKNQGIVEKVGLCTYLNCFC